MAKKTKKKKPARKVVAKRKPVAKKKKAAPAKKKAAPAKKKAAPAKKAVVAKKKSASVQRSQLRKEERALERDVENEEPRTTMNESAEYIPGALNDDLAKELGEAAVTSATSGTQADEDIRDEDIEEETGGPFVETSASTEFAGTDESNPEDAEPADFPTPNRRN